MQLHEDFNHRPSIKGCCEAQVREVIEVSYNVKVSELNEHRDHLNTVSMEMHPTQQSACITAVIATLSY